MTTRFPCLLLITLMLASTAFAVENDIDKELAQVSVRLVPLIKKGGFKKVAVLDFTDLHDVSLDLGAYIAEELTIELVMIKDGYSLIDRSNLKRILAEHKLTAQGLVDPENAKKLGKLSGIDAIILGKILPKGQNVELTVKIINTQSGEILEGNRGLFKSDENVQKLMVKNENAGRTTKGGNVLQEELKSLKTFGDLKIDFESLQIVNGRYQLRLQFTNLNQKKSIWTGLNSVAGYAKAQLTSPNGTSYNSSSVTGTVEAGLDMGSFFQGTEIPPKESTSVVMNFNDLFNHRQAEEGVCRIQAEFYTGSSFDGYRGQARICNLTAKVETTSNSKD